MIYIISCSAKFRVYISILTPVQKEGNRDVTRKIEYYNLDAILSVGYRVNSVNATASRRWSNTILKQYLLQGYSINRHLVALQERTDQRFADIEQRLDNQQKQIDFFVRTNVPPIEGIFYERQVLDARLFAEQLIKIAKREVVLIDNCIDSRSFDILELRSPHSERANGSSGRNQPESPRPFSYHR